MSSNSSSDPSADSGDSSNNLQNYLAGAALAVSLVALIVSTFQLLQQYYGSTSGLASCSEVVIGKWSQFTERKFRWSEFRFEVRFAAPVLFVAAPNNPYGPLGDHDVQEIIYMNGQNYEETHTWTGQEFKLIREAKLTGRETVHTADNELSSWVTMLMAIQNMELESHKWAYSIKKEAMAPGDTGKALKGHTLAIAIQKKRRTWDSMPGDMKKPYATTALCHMIEMMAMLGIHWKEFDRSTNAYRAQGNGFVVTGVAVPNLGIGFTFEKTGVNKFQESRIIPNDKVKQLCFGFCPTLFQLGRDVKIFADEPKDYGTLQLGTKAEIANTLVAFSCNTNTVNYFRLGNEHTRYSHLFPVAFEMLGMVGEVLQIRDKPFTMLPNPSTYSWDISAFSLINMIEAFERKLRRSLNRKHDECDVLAHIKTSHRLRQIMQDARLAKIAATNERDSKRDMDIIALVAAEAKKIKQEEERKKAAKQMKESRTNTLSPASAPKSTLLKALTFIMWFLQPIIFFMRPVVLLAISISSDFHKLLIELDVVEEKTAKMMREQKAPPPAETLGRPSKQIMIETLHNAIAKCDLFLSANRHHSKYIFALHMEELMCYLNSRPYDEDEYESSSESGVDGDDIGDTDSGKAKNNPKRNNNKARTGDGPPRTNFTTHTYSPPPSDKKYYNADYKALRLLDTAPWEKRDAMLIDVYLNFIRRRVLNRDIPRSLQMYEDPGLDLEMVPDAAGRYRKTDTPYVPGDDNFRAQPLPRQATTLSERARQIAEEEFRRELAEKRQAAIRDVEIRNRKMAMEARQKIQELDVATSKTQEQPRAHRITLTRHHSRDAQVSLEKDSAENRKSEAKQDLLAAENATKFSRALTRSSENRRGVYPSSQHRASLVPTLSAVSSMVSMSDRSDVSDVSEVSPELAGSSNTAGHPEGTAVNAQGPLRSMPREGSTVSTLAEPSASASSSSTAPHFTVHYSSDTNTDRKSVV